MAKRFITSGPVITASVQGTPMSKAKNCTNIVQLCSLRPELNEEMALINGWRTLYMYEHIQIRV